MSEKLDGRHEWPLMIEDTPGFPDDDRKPGVHLLETDYSVEGEETKRTAQLIASPHGAYWWICDWERHDTKDGRPYWFNRSGFSVSTGLIEQLTKLGAQA